MAARRTSTAPTPVRAGAAVVRRVLVAWLAILGLVVQLSAAAACTMGSQPAGPAADIAAFPICHAQGADEGSTRGRDGGHAPSHQAPCPFCALHCHAALASPPTIGTVVAAVTVAAVERRPVPPRGRSTVRVCAAASPRGPPRA